VVSFTPRERASGTHWIDSGGPQSLSGRGEEDNIGMDLREEG
jgi:hypothetical protein